ncbi:ester cyclase [Nonomuraea angiospora]|uniref:Ester cyclase n=1 Tax=Nonomuraea angiospora TaxID=46172 RepID=A0ABR9LNX8_9ACTN|nr:ester cyclase [Nonomuraea angiospora]MBE1582368.1 hypothetical protein [Nonomuraea angiospora]
MNDIIGQRNIANARLLLEDAMPNGRFDVIRSLVTPDAPIRRAGFADLYTATGDAIPTVMLQFHMTAPHSGTFAGAPGTGERVEWDEIGVPHFDDEGKITDLWFMCQELSLAGRLGYTTRPS